MAVQNMRLSRKNKKMVDSKNKLLVKNKNNMPEE
jgi:hypothetical protein